MCWFPFFVCLFIVCVFAIICGCLLNVYDICVVCGLCV